MTISTNLSTKTFDILSKANRIAGPENRLILGVSALATQPFIDYFNKSTDKKTRKYSVCKTISKIVVGTAVGVAVRALAIKYSGKLINHMNILQIAPDALTNPKTKEMVQKTVGDILALGVCLFTNFLIDAPLTKKCTNFLIKNFVEVKK